MQTSNTVSQQQRTGTSGASVTVLTLTGDISSASKEILMGSYEALDPAMVPNILYDFKPVAYLNSSGIAVVIQMLIAAKKAGQKVALCGLTPHFTKVFTMVGITKYTTLHADEAAALESF